MKYDIAEENSGIYFTGKAVFLDNKRVLYVQRFDTDTGEIEAPLINRAGQLVFDYLSDDFVIEKRIGNITIRDSDAWTLNQLAREIPSIVEGNPFLIADDDPRGVVPA